MGNLSNREIQEIIKEKDNKSIEALINERLLELVKEKPDMTEREAILEKGIIILQYYSTIPAASLEGLSIKEKYEKLKENYINNGKTEQDMFDIIKGFGK